MVRVNRASHGNLKKLAARQGRPIHEILADAIEQYRRAELLNATNRAYARLRRQAAAWREHQRERAGWDKTLADGLGEK